MADKHTPQQRSYNMSQVRSKNTKPEMMVRKFLFAHGFRYRLHDKKLPGKPDMVLPKYKKIIFIHGCRVGGPIFPRPWRMPICHHSANAYGMVAGKNQRKPSAGHGKCCQAFGLGLAHYHHLWMRTETHKAWTNASESITNSPSRPWIKKTYCFFAGKSNSFSMPSTIRSRSATDLFGAFRVRS